MNDPHTSLTPKSTVRMSLTQFWSIIAGLGSILIVVLSAYYDLKSDARLTNYRLSRLEQAAGVRAEPARAPDGSVSSYPMLVAPQGVISSSQPIRKGNP